MSSFHSPFNRIRTLVIGDAIIFVGLSLLTGITGIGVNILIARSFGVTTLGWIVRLNGMMGVVALPGNALGPAVARWLSGRPDWKRSTWSFYWWGMAVGFGWTVLLWSFNMPSILLGEHLPMFDLLPLGCANLVAFIPTIQYGAFWGAAKYNLMAITNALPIMVRALAVILVVLATNSRLLPSLLWTFATAGWMSVVITSVVLWKTKDVKEAAPPATTKNILRISLIHGILDAWRNWDVVWLGRFVVPSDLGTLAVVVSVGRVPFHLVAQLANRGIGESFRKKSRYLVFVAILMIILSIFILGTWLGWTVIRDAFGLAQVSGTRLAVIFYGISSSFLAMWYHDAGQETEEGGSRPGVAGLAGLVCWSVGVFLFWRIYGSSLNILLYGCSMLAMAAVGSWVGLQSRKVARVIQ